MKNWKQYQDAYNAATDPIKGKIHSSLIPECVVSACLKYELDDTHKQILIRLFADKILGLADDTATTESMRSVGIPAAAVIYKEIDQCLATKQPSIPDTSLVENIQIVAEEATDNVKLEITESNSLAAELAETEATFKELQPIRTMAHDMQSLKREEPTHQAARKLS